MTVRDVDLKRTAASAGLITQWRDAFGAVRDVPLDTLRALMSGMSIDGDSAADERVLPKLIVASATRTTVMLPAALAKRNPRARLELENGDVVDVATSSNGRLRFRKPVPPGYHRLQVGAQQSTLAVALDRCFGVADALGHDANLFGIAAQIYSLRRRGDFGYGDFTALAQFAGSAARHGASAIALSPVHAMFAADATKYSPYSPSNRAYLNTLFADVDALQRVEKTATTRRERDAMANSILIDWPRSAARQRAALESAFQHFEQGRSPGTADFREFRDRCGASLDRHALFEALDEHDAHRAKPSPTSRASTTFAAENGKRIALHRFAQWLAARGLATAQATARAGEMPIGLIADFAVGVDPSGSECWSQPQNMVIGATIGAPPDALNAIGQNWGLTTYSPIALLREGFAPFLEVLRAVMRHAGGVRLDHVMSLMRLWMIPRGAKATQGAYLRYPFEDLVRLVALESWRHRCIVIGEDLGTVPEDCRVQLADAGILGLDVLPFMRNGAAFVPAHRWRRNAVAMTSTHDVATVAGWWRGRDLDWRRRLHLFGEHGEKAERAERSVAKTELHRALPGSMHASSPARVVDGAIAYVAASASPLAIIPVEDLVGEVEQPNLPGTIAEHPNWRRRYRADAAQLLEKPDVTRRLTILARHRKQKL